MKFKLVLSPQLTSELYFSNVQLPSSLTLSPSAISVYTSADILVAFMVYISNDISAFTSADILIGRRYNGLDKLKM